MSRRLLPFGDKERKRTNKKVGVNTVYRYHSLPGAYTCARRCTRVRSWRSAALPGEGRPGERGLPKQRRDSDDPEGGEEVRLIHSQL